MNWLRALCFVLTLSATACDHRPVHSSLSTPAPSHPAASPAEKTDASALPEFAVDAVATQEGKAAWYDVPDRSLAQRRAWAEEMTAASDTLPQNTYARVRRLDGKGAPVVLRITDHGVHRKGVLVDVSRPAAEALDIVRSGEARVRVETLALKNASTDKPVEKKSDAPTAVAKLTATPAADQQAEKDAANAKGGGVGQTP